MEAARALRVREQPGAASYHPTVRCLPPQCSSCAGIVRPIYLSIYLDEAIDGTLRSCASTLQPCASTLQPYVRTQVGLSTDIKDVLASDVLGSVLPRAQGYGEALPADRHVT